VWKDAIVVIQIVIQKIADAIQINIRRWIAG
jgi:hypothetical protein